MFGIRNLDRRQHMYLIGKTGKGKTVLIKNMVLQDIRAGHGVAVVDPHGEFVEEIAASIPPERINDVVYFNPADQDHAIGFNVLEVSDPKYKHLVASGLMGIFTKIWSNVWSARMEYILNNCVLALLDIPGSTLLGIPRILVDKVYREKVVANVKDPVVRSFWVHEYEAYNERFRSEAIAPIQNKVGQFLNTSLIRNIVGQSKSTINIDDIMNSRKILLVNVSKGRIGEDNSALLGAMVITKVQLAAMERVRIAEEERQDFYLYVDEFQNFATDSFAGILSEARKYRLNLIIAHQYTGQLVTDLNTKVRDAGFGNCGTMVVFRIGATDAELLEPEFEPEFIIQDLVNLPNYHTYVKLMCEGVTSRPFSATTLPPIKVELSQDSRQNIIDVSRRQFARPSGIVEEEVQRWSAAVDVVPQRQDEPKQAVKEEVRHREFDRTPRARFLGHLGKLDIEFEASVVPERPASLRRVEMDPQPQVIKVFPDSPRTVQSQPAAPKKREAAKEFSLSEVLKPRTEELKERKQRKEVDVDELRKALADSLRKAGSPVAESRGEPHTEDEDNDGASAFSSAPSAAKDDDDGYSYDDEK